MLGVLKIVRRLVNCSSAAEFSDFVSRYGMKGKIIELATSLLIAPKKSLSIEDVHVPSDSAANLFKKTI